MQDTGTNKLFDPSGQWLGFVNSSGTFIAQTVNLGGRPLSIYSSANNDTYFIHPNLLGSTTMSTTHSGSVSEDVLYYPWGQFWTSGGTLYEHHFATFAVEDTTTGVDPTLFRDYKTTHGRWLSPDPAGLGAVDLSNPQSLNRYAYVMNNPLSMTDPMGLTPAHLPNCTNMQCAEQYYGGTVYMGYQNVFGVLHLQQHRNELRSRHRSV